MILLVFGTGLCHSEEYIDITRFSSRKTPIAIPVFKTTPGGVSQISIDASGLLSRYLDFSGYFKILDRRTFLMDPANPVSDAASINFPNWSAIGAEMLVTGEAFVQNDLVEIDLRLFDVVKGELLLGKRYKGWSRDMPRIIRMFAAEIIHHMTGTWGVFDTKIAFVSNGTGNKEIFVCDFDGSNVRQITSHNSITLSPAWSSDGKWMAYTSYAMGSPDLYIRNLGQSVVTRVARKGINITPAWIPGRFELAATLSFSGDQEIYLLTGKGEVVRKLTDKWGIDTSPAWSPDGTRMAFVSDRSGNPQIYIKDIRSGAVTRLTYQGKYNTQPSWSPRGDKIAYSAVEGGQINIQVADVQSRQSARLTYSSGKNESPSWSPDGNLIVFSSTREGGSGIYVMTAYGTDQRRLLKLPGEQSMPRWSPNMINNQ